MIDKNKWWFEKTYNSLVEKAKMRGHDKSKLTGYYESHHILPRCLGGTNDLENLVLLNYREHVICHVLLVRIYPDNIDLIRAADFMLNVDRFDENGNKITIKLKNTKIAEEIKMKQVELNKGETHPSFGTHISEEHKKILSIVNSHPKSLETRKRMAEKQIGKHHSEESKEKMRLAKLGKKSKHDRHKKYKISIEDKNIIFNTIKECAEYFNVSSTAIKGWLKRGEKGLKLIE